MKGEAVGVGEVKRLEILGVPIDMVTGAGAMEVFLGLMRGKSCSLIVTPNSEIVLNATCDKGLFEIIESADLIIPDGIGLVHASKILKNPLKERVTGIDFLSDILGYLEENGKSIYLLGSKPGVAELAAAKMVEKHPGLIVAGTHHGYFDHAGEGAVVDGINVSGAEFLCVAMGSPRQEKFIQSYRHEFSNVQAAMGVGGSLDVWAGTLKRAPDFYRKCGLEWLYRVFQEPARIKRVVKLPLFLLKVMFYKSK